MARLRDAPHRILISLGTNGQITAFADDARAILEAIPASTQMWWPKVRGGTAATVNPALEHLAATDTRLHVIDLKATHASYPAGDGVHLTADGYDAAWQVAAAAFAGPDTDAAGSLDSTSGVTRTP